MTRVLRHQLPGHMSMEDIYVFNADLFRHGDKFEHLVIETPASEEAFASPTMLVGVFASVESWLSARVGRTVEWPSIDERPFWRDMRVHWSSAALNEEKDFIYFQNSISLNAISRRKLIVDQKDWYEEIQDLIESHSVFIASFIFGDDPKMSEAVETFAYSMRELLRNVFEHGEIDEAFYMAQYWPKSNKVEIAVCDFGIGIRRSLMKNPAHRLGRDGDAVMKAVQPDVSGSSRSQRGASRWSNSGYGLYMMRSLCALGGKLNIISKRAGVVFLPKTTKEHSINMNGTIVGINMDLNQIGKIRERLNEFRNRAAELAGEVLNRPPSEASLRTRMRRDR